MPLHLLKEIQELKVSLELKAPVADKKHKSKGKEIKKDLQLLRVKKHVNYKLRYLIKKSNFLIRGVLKILEDL